MKKAFHWAVFFPVLAVAIAIPSPAHARPEYATKEKLNCVACHATPWGGGPRNLMGKSYGSHGHDPAKTSASDLYYGSLRFIDYFSTESSAARPHGAGIMEAAVTANAAIVQNESGSEMRGVLTYNMPTLSPAGPREAYIRFQFAPHEGHGPTPCAIVLGRFYVPFGLLTDEHRTYTRIQTNMTINNYDIGGAASLNPLEDLHVDLALVSDFQTGGSFVATGIPWGFVGNVRWNPPTLPFLLGVSGNFQRTQNVPEPYAGSLYTVLSADRLTEGKVSGSLSFESVIARNWNNPTVNTGLVNPPLTGFFGLPSGTTINEATSLGFYGLLKYNLTHVWTLVYKYDYFRPDVGGAFGSYFRNGFGFEAYLNSNLIWNVRYENASAPDTAATGAAAPLAAQSDIFTMLRLWI